MRSARHAPARAERRGQYGDRQVAGYPVVDRVSEVLRLARDRRVLHLGCTNWPYTADAIRDGSLLHARLATVASSLVGVDADAEGLATLGAGGFDALMLADIERLGDVEDHALMTPRFDLVVAAEVIEHVNNPGLMLGGVARLLAPGGTLVVTTVNAYGAVRIAPYALRGRGGELEPVHPDHVAYYSPSTLRLLLERERYEVTGTSFYGLAPEHRLHAAWWIKLANDIGTRLAKQLSDGLVMTATFGSPPGQPPSSPAIQS